jgi:primary-amine oxidase
MFHRHTYLIVVMSLFLGADARAQNDVGFPVKWQKWAFSWQIRPREGVVLREVTFDGRPVLKYAGVAEVFVPYHAGEPRPMDQRDHPFGKNMIPLEPGADCLPGGQCEAFDKDGKRTARRASVMIHEDAPAIVHLGRTQRTRAKMLTLWSAYALGDYTYIFQWRFGEDGSIMPRVGLTGRLAHFGGEEDEGSEVGANERALGHVHNFFYCLDFDVDGPKNTVEEFDYSAAGERAEKGKVQWTAVTKEGARELSPRSFRTWRVVNRESKNRLGLPRSYELVPGGTGIYRGARDEPFAQGDLWVTRYKPDEVPGTKLLADGLPGYANGEDVAGQDVVLWYMMSVHHLPRTEEWPAMSVEWVGFKLMPRDFLDGGAVGGR